jgi:hypothetical protein
MATAVSSAHITVLLPLVPTDLSGQQIIVCTFDYFPILEHFGTFGAVNASDLRSQLVLRS